MLNPQPDRCEGILDLVGDLTRHLAPCQDTFGARYFDPAELQVPCQTPGRDAAQPKRRKRTGRSREKNQHSEIPASPIHYDIIAPSRGAEDVTLLARTENRTVAEEHFRGAAFCFPRR